MPLLVMLAAFATGVALLQTRAELPGNAWSLIAMSAAVGITIFARRARPLGCVEIAALGVAVALAGYGYAACRAEARLSDSLAPEWEGVDLAVVGVVDDLPRRTEHGARFAFAVERADTHGAHVPARLSLAWPTGPPDGEHAVSASVRAGERWSLVVRLKRPHGAHNGAGGFDLEAWLLERNLRATGYVRVQAANVRVDAFAARWRDFVGAARESVRDRALAALAASRYAPVLVALAIGDQSGLSEGDWAVFNRTGTGHLISISGLHVTVFAMLAGGFALALARRSPALTSRIAARRVAAAFGVVASFGYVLIAGAEIPAQRTLLMLIVAAAGLWIGRPGTGVVVWAWALCAVLAFDPWAVLAPGFWLSFFAVGLLIYVTAGRCAERASGNVATKLLAALAKAARSQWAITLGLVPLSLALFGQVSLIGPLANAIAIPAITFVVVPLALAASAIPVDALWTLAHALLAPLMHALEFLATLPNAAWLQHRPPTWTVVLGVAAVALCLAPRGVPGRWLGIIALAPLFIVLAERPPAPGTFRLSVLDVGQGTAVVVRTHEHTLLYDTGPRWSETSDAGARIVAPYLRAAGIRTLDALVVSHRDLDHAGGALSVLNAVPVGFVLSSLADDHEILVAQDARGQSLRCVAGQHWAWDGVRFDVLFPEREHHAEPARKSNDLSCVLRVSAEGASALLAGDIEARSEIDLVTARRGDLGADVLVVPHHGSRTSSTSSFIDAVAPRHAVFTVGYRNRYAHPRADIVGRYVTRGAIAHRTDRTGMLTFELGPYGTGPPLAARERWRRYWHALP